MKTVLLIFVLIAFSIEAKPQGNYPFSAGPYLSAKTGYNANYSPLDRKSLLTFNGIPDFGFSFYFPAGQDNKLGLITDIGLTTYAYRVRGINEGLTFDMRYSYFTISPSFYFSGIVAGFNLGLPVSADYGSKIETSKLNLLAEVKAGGIIPIISDENGRVNVIITVGYMLNGIYKNFVKDDPLLQHFPPDSTEKFTSEFNPRAFSIVLGLNYMFNF
jgi:hypothetical protein